MIPMASEDATCRFAIMSKNDPLRISARFSQSGRRGKSQARLCDVLSCIAPAVANVQWSLAWRMWFGSRARCIGCDVSVVIVESRWSTS